MRCDQGLDPGERESILLALHLRADLVLMDDREGVELGLIDLAAAIAALRQTNFRIHPSILERLLVRRGAGLNA